MNRPIAIAISTVALAAVTGLGVFLRKRSKTNAEAEKGKAAA